MERTSAVFHDRGRVDDVVRELTNEGIGEEDILIEEHPDQSKPHTLGDLSYPTQFSAVGGGIGMITGVAVGGASNNALSSLWLVIVCSMAGGLIGGIVGFVFAAFRSEHRAGKRPHDWLVRVDAPDAVVAARTRQLIRELGGELVPSA